MAKTRFNKDKLEVYLSWMMEQYDEKQKGKLDGAKAKALAAVNAAIRDKYAEEDMVVLRKYSLSSTDNCIKFVDNNGAFFAFDFGYVRHGEKSGIVDLPYARGCRSQDVYKVNQSSRKAIEDYTSAKAKAADNRGKKFDEYHSFLRSCRNVEDANDIVPLPDELLKKLVASNSTSLIAFNPELLTSIRKEFSHTKPIAAAVN